MPSLAALRANSYFAIILLLGLLLFLLVGIVWALAIPPSLGLPLVVAFTVIIMLMQWSVSTWIVEKATRMRYLKPGENPFLEQTVRDLCEKADVPVPRIGIVENETPNAFVFGKTRKGARLAVHTGLLKQLNEDEIRGVLAHEIGHIKHRDAMVMTFLSVIPLIAYMGSTLLWFGGGRNRQGAALLVIGLVSLLVYFVSQLIILRLSRIREYYADSFSAYVTGKPRSLASALTKITYGLSLSRRDEPTGVRAFYIADHIMAATEMRQIASRAHEYDLNGDGVLDERELELAMEREARRSRLRTIAEILSTHPPTYKRIMALREIEKEMATGSISGVLYRKM